MQNNVVFDSKEGGEADSHSPEEGLPDPARGQGEDAPAQLEAGEEYSHSPEEGLPDPARGQGEDAPAQLKAREADSHSPEEGLPDPPRGQGEDAPAQLEAGEDDSHSPEEGLPDPPRGQGENAPAQLEAGEDGEAEEPEPEEDVDLLVHDVEGEDAEAVHCLDGAGRAVLFKRALRHLPTQQTFKLEQRLFLIILKVHRRENF
jgi:hypothetical protein